MPAAETLPDIHAALTELLGLVPEPERPLLIANLERLAADRYRGWAEAFPAQREGLLTCATREETIARKVEAAFPGGAATAARILETNPDLPDRNRSLFEPHPLEDQLALQAQGERLGAAAWRSIAEAVAEEALREVLLDCALLEEENASFLESLTVA